MFFPSWLIEFMPREIKDTKLLFLQYLGESPSLHLILPFSLPKEQIFSNSVLILKASVDCFGQLWNLTVVSKKSWCEILARKKKLHHKVWFGLSFVIFK